jgi:hypothetical protein
LVTTPTTGLSILTTQCFEFPAGNKNISVCEVDDWLLVAEILVKDGLNEMGQEKECFFLLGSVVFIGIW